MPNQVPDPLRNGCFNNSLLFLKTFNVHCRSERELELALLPDPASRRAEFAGQTRGERGEPSGGIHRHESRQAVRQAEGRIRRADLLPHQRGSGEFVRRTQGVKKNLEGALY